MSWLSDLIAGMLSDWANAILVGAFALVDSFFAKYSTVIGMKDVNSALGVANTLASSFLVLLLMKQILTIHILEIDGDPDQSPLKILEKGCIALAAINLQGYLLSILMSLADSISSTINKSLSVEFDNLEHILTTIGSVFSNPVLAILLLLVYVIGFCMFLWKGLKRSAELALMKILFPLFVCDVVTVSMERFRAFISSYLTVIFGFIVQMTLFKLSMLMIFNEGDLWLAIAFIFLASSAPKWLEKFTYSTGAARGASNMARSAASMIPQMIRMVK